MVAIVTVPFLAYANTAVQMISPQALRGRLAALLAIPIVVAGSLGPVLVGALTDFLFRDESKLGWSMAVVFCTAIPLALLSFRLCLKPLFAAVVHAENANPCASAGGGLP